MNRSFWTAPSLAVIGGLALLLAAGAGWVAGVDSREVSGVVLDEPTTTSGTAFAPAAVVAGLVGLGGGALLGVLRGASRRGAGLVVSAAGLFGLVVVARGLLEASQADGAMTPAPFFAAAAAVALVAAGASGARGPARPPVASRYRVSEERPADDEWSLAADEETQRHE